MFLIFGRFAVQSDAAKLRTAQVFRPHGANNPRQRLSASVRVQPQNLLISPLTIALSSTNKHHHVTLGRGVASIKGSTLSQTRFC